MKVTDISGAIENSRRISSVFPISEYDQASGIGVGSGDLLQSLRINNFSRSCSAFSLIRTLSASILTNNDIIGKNDWSNLYSQALNDLSDSLLHSLPAYREERTLYSIGRLRAAVTSPHCELSRDTIDKIIHALDEIRSLQSEVKALSDTPRLISDGLIRSNIYYMAPEVMVANRVRRKLDPTTCEVAVIGAGPAGLAATYALGTRGIDVIAFDAYIGQGMSDARAASVHVMRTNASGSSPFRAGLVPDHIRSAVGLESIIASSNLRELAHDALVNLCSKTGIKIGCELPARDNRNPADPVTRGEVFSSFAEIAAHISQMPSATLLEQAPISEVTWLSDEGLFHLKTFAGHEIKAKRVVLASGFVGSEGQYGTMIPDLANLESTHPDHFVLMQSENDLTSKCETLCRITTELATEGISREQVIISDAILGHPEMISYIRALPEGTRVAVIGSGESAAKDTLQLLYLNRGIKVDLFVKGKLEPSQGHTPYISGVFDPVVQGVLDPAYGDATRLAWLKDFGTPITPDSFLEIFDNIISGRVRLFELGKHFSEKALDIELVDIGQEIVTRISIDKSEEDIRPNLARQCEECSSHGIEINELVTSDGVLSEINGPMIVAIGYDRVRMRHDDPISAQLLSQGLIKLKESGGKGEQGEVVLAQSNNLVSSANPKLGLAGAINIASFGDGSFSGGGTRGWLLAQVFADELRGENQFKEIVERYTRHTSLTQPSAATQPFPGSPKLSALAIREPSTLRPSERIMLARATALQSRIHAALAARKLC